MKFGKRTQDKPVQEKAEGFSEELFDNICHELRTPINSILGLNEMNLREETISAEIEENSLFIQSAGQTLVAMFDDIVDLYKIRCGKMKLVENQYEIIPLIRDLYTTFKPKANEKHLQFVLDVAPDVPIVLWGDRVRIKQVVEKLLANAVKYTDEGQIILRIQCAESNQGKVKLWFSVVDTGIGIKKDELPWIFEEYRHLEEKKSRDSEGNGLGLAIGKRLAEMMGGEILVDSIYKKGSTFTFAVAQGVVDRALVGPMNELLREKTGQNYQYQRIFEAPEARVLVVDDNELSRLVVKKLLRECRVHLDMAESGRKCLELTRKKQYNVILLDHVMPEMDGIETLEHIRNQEDGLNRQTPVVAMTANVAAGIEKEYIAKGFDAYLMKPISGSMLESMVLKFLPQSIVEKYYSEDEAIESMGLSASSVIAADKKHKASLRITVESTCDLTEELLREKGIDRIGCYVKTQDGRFRDGEEITHDAVMDYLKQGKDLEMETPSVEEYEEFFANELDGAYQVLHICASSRVEAAYRDAKKASGAFGNVYVFDSGLVSGGVGLLALYATDLMKRGMQLAEIIRELERCRHNMTAAFVVGDAKPFLYNRKIGLLKGWYCRLFDRTLTIHMHNGELRCIPIGGRKDRVFRRFVRRQLRMGKPERTERLVMVYTECPSDYRNIILEELKRRIHFNEILLLPASASGSAVSGRFSCGIYYINEKQR
jgi:DegV family protein with EDD domain